MFLVFLALCTSTNAQQTEDEVYVGKGKTFGSYTGRDIIIPDFDRKAKSVDGETTLTGIVVGIGTLNCEKNSCTANSINVKKADGTIVTIGTKDFEFRLPKEIKGRKINIEGIEFDTYVRKRRAIKKDFQKDVQMFATGMKILD